MYLKQGLRDLFQLWPLIAASCPAEATSWPAESGRWPSFLEGVYVWGSLGKASYI